MAGVTPRTALAGHHESNGSAPGGNGWGNAENGYGAYHESNGSAAGRQWMG